MKTKLNQSNLNKVQLNRPIFQLKSVVKIMSLFLAPISLFSTHVQAEPLSYFQAEQTVLNKSYATQAAQNLQEAASLQAQAVERLGWPRVDLNATAYKLHSEIDVPLSSVKQRLEGGLSGLVNQQIDQWGNIIPPESSEQIKDGVNNIIQNGVNTLIPDQQRVTIDEHGFRPSVSVSMPVYTGGLITGAKKVAQIQAQNAELTAVQAQNLARFEIIQLYFNVQLEHKLVQSAAFNLDAMQQHLDNAIKFEKQGFINKGLRMQFEVARNDAQRVLQTTQSTLKSNQFKLKQLLQTEQVNQLSTPLFINTRKTFILDQLLDSYQNHSTVIQKLQKDQQLADQNIKVQQATKKPTLLAFGEYSPGNKQDWIVGIIASYNIFSGIDKSKNIRAAELQRYALALSTEQAKQQIENIIDEAYTSLTNSQETHQLLLNNRKAALENLRIQSLSFKEGMGTATSVIDAQNALNALNTQMATNAYKYVVSLATLLQSYGSIEQFKTYVNQKNTDYIQ